MALLDYHGSILWLDCYRSRRLLGWLRLDRERYHHERQVGGSLGTRPDPAPRDPPHALVPHRAHPNLVRPVAVRRSREQSRV